MVESRDQGGPNFRAGASFNKIGADFDVVVGDLLAVGSEPLFGDEKDGRGKTVTGQKRVLLNGREGQHLAVAKYGEPMRDYMSGIINGDTGDLKKHGVETPRPLGHVELGYKEGSAGFRGIVYFSDTGDNVGYFECTVNDEDPLSEASRACAEFAIQTGFGDVWLRHLYEVEQTQQGSRSYATTLPGTTMHNLSQFVQAQSQ